MMSEMTLCNYCHYQDIRRRADEENALVELRPEEYLDGQHTFLTGQGVYVDGSLVGWFMELTDHCVC